MENKKSKENWLTIQVPEGTYLITPEDRKDQKRHWEAVLAYVTLHKDEKNLIDLLESEFVIGSAYTMAIPD